MSRAVRPDTRMDQRLGDEVDMSVMVLDYLRASIVSKLDGLDDEEARQALVPSGTNLLGLIRHLTMAEARWFGQVFAGSDDPLPTRSMDVTAADSITEVTATYQTRTALSNAQIATANGDPTAMAARPGWSEPVNLRWVLLHMIEETARHAGHADILREQIDGAVGR